MKIKINSERDLPILRRWVDALVIHSSIVQYDVPIKDFLDTLSGVHINVYLENQSYGGPEEGGWYYNCGYPAEEWISDPIYAEYRTKKPSGYTAEDYINNYLDRIEAEIERAEEWVETHNHGRPTISSVNSRGKFHMRIEEDEPRAYPDITPHYE